MTQSTAHDKPKQDRDPTGGHTVGHVVPLKLLAAVFGALVFLTVVTVAVSTVDFGEFNLIIALAIAVLKASLVVLFFMHLIWDRPFNSIVFIGCLIFVSLFIGFSLLDGSQYHSSVQEKQGADMKHVPMKAESPEAPVATPAK